MSMRSSRRRRAWRASLAALAVGALAVPVSACAAGDPPPQEDQSITIAVNALIADWSPYGGAAAFATSLQYNAVYDTLLIWDWASDTAEASAPSLATDAAVSEDRLALTINLRDDVDFVDGVHMDADAIVTYFTGLLESELALAGSLSPYEPTFEATGEYQVVVSTTKPIYDPEFTRTIFAYTPILSPATVDDQAAAAETPIGSGPYLVDEFDPDVSLRLVRNPDYWNPDAYPFDEVELRVLPDPTARLNALKSGQIDASQITIQQAPEAERSDLTVVGSGAVQDALWVRDPVNSTEPALRDVRVREAMMLAFDRQAIADSVYLGYAEVSSQPSMEGQPHYIDGGDTRFGYDPERARELMAEAGYESGFALTIPSWSGSANLEPIVQQYLGDIGIQVSFETMPDIPALNEANASGRYPLVMGQNSYLVITYQIVAPGETGWIIATDEVVEMLTTIKEGTAEESARASQSLGELLLDEAWIIPFGKPLRLWSTTKDVALDLSNNRTLEPALRYFQPAS